MNTLFRNVFAILEEMVKISSSAMNCPEGYGAMLIKKLNDCKRGMRMIRQKCNNDFKGKFSMEEKMLGYSICLHIDLFLLIWDFFGIEPKKKFEHISDGSNRMYQIRHFGLFLSNLVNSLLGIHLLIENGLHLQAKQLFRSYIEYADIGIAVLADQDFYVNYRTMGDSKEQQDKVWWNYTRPRALNKILEKIFKDEELKDFWGLYRSIREPMYSHYSDYVHAHHMANLDSAFSYDDQRRKNVISVGGAITSEMNHTLDSLILFSRLFIQIAMIVLVKYQRLPFNLFGKDGEEFVAFYSSSELIFKYVFIEYRKEDHDL
ncbi:MAG: hypothetical protein HGB01_04380 [Chlorobiaceae bacterium]|nr:hypothetical protein [Chlorobiaceae bacterium]